MSAEQTTAVEKKRPVAVGSQGIIIADMDGMWRWSQYVAASGLAPKGIEKPESIFVATQMGLEVGLSPMAALQNIAVINGRPTIWGDAQLGIVRSTGELEEFDEWYEVKGSRTTRNPSEFTDDVAAVCRVKRRGFETQESAFSVADAKRANLWGKQGPWSQYPARMLRFRARSFALRDNFGDALRGMLSTEEARDMGPAIDVETVVEQPKFKSRAKAAQFIDTPVAKPANAVTEPANPIPTDTTTGNRETDSAANREPSNPTGGEAQPAPAAGPVMTPAQSKLAAIIESEGCTFDTLLFVCGDPTDGISAWRHLVKDCSSLHDMRSEYVDYLVSKEKSLRAYLRTAKEAGR